MDHTGLKSGANDAKLAGARPRWIGFSEDDANPTAPNAFGAHLPACGWICTNALRTTRSTGYWQSLFQSKALFQIVRYYRVFGINELECSIGHRRAYLHHFQDATVCFQNKIVLHMFTGDIAEFPSIR